MIEVFTYFFDYFLLKEFKKNDKYAFYKLFKIYSRLEKFLKHMHKS